MTKLKVSLMIGFLIALLGPLGLVAGIAGKSLRDTPDPKEVFRKMSLEEKVGQLIWLSVDAKQASDMMSLKKKIRQINPAGIRLHHLGVGQGITVVEQTKYLTSKGYPLLFDAEVTSIDSLILLPSYETVKNLTGDFALTEQYLEAVDRHLSALGANRATYYGRSLDLSLVEVSGHSETLKKSLYEHDGVLISESLPFWFDLIYQMVRTGEIPRDFFETKVQRILEIKAALSDKPREEFATETYLRKYALNESSDVALADKLRRHAFKLVRDEGGLIWSDDISRKKHLYLTVESLDSNKEGLFTSTFGFYRDLQFGTLERKYDRSEYVLYAIITENTDRAIISKLEELNKTNDVFITYLGNGVRLRHLGTFRTLLWHPEENEHTWKMAPQVIFSASSGSLGLLKESGRTRLGFGSPEMVGMDAATLARIDLIAKEMILTHAAPGCQVLVARNGVIVYDKSFGFMTYDQKDPVTSNTLYDLASITKVLATIPMVMKLDEQGKIDINAKASIYLPELKGSPKQDITIRDILSHQSGLYPYLPFWRQTVNEDGELTELYSSRKHGDYLIEVAQGVYSQPGIKDSLWKWTVDSRMRQKRDDRLAYDYKYSDLGFYILKEILDRYQSKSMEETSQELYYQMGANRLTFNPLSRFSRSEIAPTEDDRYFRNSVIRGTVHDQTAAMFGGVAGHAGLFGNARSVAVVMQMFLQGGAYGGKRYFGESTIAGYTSQQFDNNRRGLGWDKPDKSKEGNASEYSSLVSFGHTGFTGTSAWADPEYGLVFVFLSNRIHPNVENNKLGERNIRIRIQDTIYRAIFNWDKLYTDSFQAGIATGN